MEKLGSKKKGGGHGWLREKDHREISNLLMPVDGGGVRQTHITVVSLTFTFLKVVKL